MPVVRVAHRRSFLFFLSHHALFVLLQYTHKSKTTYCSILFSRAYLLGFSLTSWLCCSSPSSFFPEHNCTGRLVFLAFVIARARALALFFPLLSFSFESVYLSIIILYYLLATRFIIQIVTYQRLKNRPV